MVDEMPRPHLELNRRSGLRLWRVVADLSGDGSAGTAASRRAWTIGVELAHMAFWDRFVAERWNHARRSNLSGPAPVDLTLADLVNDASVPGWSLIAPRDAARMALSAADEVDQLIADLADDAVEALLATGWTSLLDRSVHRDEHLEAIERQIVRSGSS